MSLDRHPTTPIIRHLIATATGVLILTLIYNQFGLAGVVTVLLFVANAAIILSFVSGWPIAGAQMRP